MRIHVVPGGPMLIEGVPIGMLRRAGDRHVVDPIATPDPCALCRCGRSGAMPLCDREAPYGCFDEEPAVGPEPAPFRWDVPDPAGAPAIALKLDGPVRVAGGPPVTYGDRSLPPVDRVSLCRCGASRSQPLCDGSHKVVGFRS
jgi:CDGSH-type Zn-finger protein